MFNIARVLGVEVSHFFAGLDGERAMEPQPCKLPPTPQQRMLREFERAFMGMPSREHQEAICNLARVFACPGPAVHENEPASTG